MTIDQVREVLHGNKPFTIRMVSGREYSVEHPDFAAIGRDLATLILTGENGRVEMIRLSQLESINAEPHAAAS